MKHFLLSICLALGICSNAQISVLENWENTTTTLPFGWVSSNYFTIYKDKCSLGIQSLGQAILGVRNSVEASYTLTYTLSQSNSNGAALDYSFDWRTEETESYGTSGGKITVEYSINSGNSWITLKQYDFNGFIDCTTESGTIEASTNSSSGIPVNSPFKFRISVVSPKTIDLNHNDYNWIIDNIKLTQRINTPPNCTTISSPINSHPNNPQAITWENTTGADGYRLYLGTSSGNYNIENGTIANSLIYSLKNKITPSTNYFVKIVPYNSIGDAIGCTEKTFSTTPLDYCTVKNYSNSSLYFISNVNYEGIDNTTTVSSRSYRDYTTLKANVKRGQTKRLTVKINDQLKHLKTYFVTAFIDWNQDKSFNTTTERIILSPIADTNTYTIDIKVPEDAILGDTRMRIIFEYNSNISNNYQPTACNSTFSSGEVEDYTLTINDETMSTINLNKNEIKIYPNPFIDLVKIADVKNVKSIYVTDMSGRQVKSLAPASELNLSGLKSGLYIINLNMTDGSVKAIKAIKK